MNTTFTTYAEKKAKQFLNLLHGYTKGIRTTAILILLVMGVANAWAANIAANTKLYLEPNSNWKSDNARFAAYFFGNGETWVSMTALTTCDGKTVYEVTSPNKSYTNVIFCRMNPSAAANNWDNKWNQTSDLTYDGTKNLYTVKEGTWDKGGGTWSAYTFTVTINSTSNGTINVTAGGSTTSVTTSNKTINVAPNSSITVAFTPNTGYELDSYKIKIGNNSESTKTSGQDFTICGNTTISATSFKLKTHTVSYGVCSTTRWGSIQLNSETAITTTGTKTLNYGTPISFTATPNPGYQVEGWYSNSSCTSKITAAGTSTTYDAGTLTADKTVYVKFEAIPVNSHNITYTEQGEGWTYGNSNPTSAEEGAQVTFVVTPTAGYRVSVTSTDVTLNTNGNNYTFTMPNKDVEITVDAKPEQYTVTLNKQSGEGGTSSVIATYAAAMPRVTAPTRTGYTFNGYFDATSGGTKYYNADGSSAKNWDKTSETTLYAQWTANTYEITYKDKGDATFSGTHASGAPTQHTYGTETALKEATKNGYTFDGWFTASDCSGSAVTSLGATDYTANITLYAKWTELPPTTVYLKPNSNWKTNNARFAIYCWNSAGNIWYDMTKIDCEGNYYVAEIPTAYSDFKFVRLNPATTENNWNNGTKWNETGDLKVPTDNKILFTVANTNDWNGATTTWSTMTYPTYTITLNRQGGTTGSEMVTATYGSAAPSITKPTRDYYAFEGYYTQQNGQGNLYIDKNGAWQNIEYIVDGKWMKPACDLTLYAKWTISAAQYTVTLNTQYGEGGSPSVQAYIGFAMPEITLPTRTGYIFGGYYTEQNGLGTQYYNADGTSAKNWDKTVATTLYAKWTPITYYVQFNANGGEGSMEEQEFTYNVPQNLTANTFTKTGYNFLRWNTKSDGSGTGYANQNNINNLTSTDKEKITLYAQWEAIKYDITYTSPTNGTYCLRVGDGGEWSGNTTAIYEQQITLKVQSEAIGYHFAGWNVTKTGGETVTVTDNKFTMPAEDITIAAIFAPNISTITWDVNDGSETTTTSTYTYNGDPIVLPSPTREGYTLNGWWTAKTGGEKIDNIGKGNNPTSDVTYYAHWTENKYTINISTDGNGSVEPSGKQQIGISGMEVTATPTDPNRFRFTKWEVSSGVQVSDPYGATTTITATADGEVIAHFEELQPKTIYLKTVEETTDGFNWYVQYNSTEVMMTPLGCTGEYYRGEVPEETEFQLIAKDNGGNIIAKETRDGLVIPNDGKNLLNLVSAADKIFFKPNSHWLTKQNGKTPRFAAHFYNPNEEWIDLVATNSDGIYECEKPAGGYTQIQFCRMKENTTENNWNNKSEQTLDLTIPTDGKNLFTVDANQELGGNNDSGTWSTHADTPVNGEGEWTIFEGATYRITFNHEGATSGTTTPGVAYVDAQYNSAMPTIESLPKNTDWKFAGYYTAANGGTAITNAFGDWLNADGYISNGKWIKEECVTLYAHWVVKTPEITNVELSKNVFDVGSVETVTATPTVVEHSYKDTYSICWKLLDNSGTVMDLFPFTRGDNNSVSFSVDGLTSGTYTVRASIYASACDTGEELSRFDAKITIVSGYKVTVKYLCGDNVIQAPSIAEGHATTPKEITAPEIGGYKFVNWELGDGIFSESDLNSQTISYTAIYDGYLTAKYEKRKLIFLDLSTLKTKANWTAPHIYLYMGAKDEQTGGYWNDQTGAGGAGGGNYITHAAMTKVPNTENIWYYDYESVNNFNAFVAFTSNNQGNASHFANCEAIYRTEFSSGTPVFVPASDQTAETKNSTAKYYSKGYWVKYMDGTGYWMIIYNAEGNKELVRREFTSETQRMTMTSIVDLEAEHTYQYEIYRNDGYYYKGGDITYTNSSDYRPLNEANKHTIKTTETGDYTFTLDYFTGDLQIKVQYPGEVGDYRILYTDDVRNKRYKPSQIISQNNKEPLVSFFIRPNDNPELKIQKATFVTENEVKWDYNNFIYLKPNSNWKADGARFAAAFLNSDKTQTVWVSMTSIEKNTTYGCAIPNGTWEYVIFCRMNGSTTENNWDNKWDQTNDLDIQTNGNNLYTIANGAWSNDGGSWSKFTNNSNIIDLSDQLEEKLAELDLKDIKETEGSVFNIHLSNNDGTPTIEKVAFYTGNYYIRVDAVDGKWYDYKTNPDNLMTYSAFSESDENSFGEKFSHYKTKWCTQGMNVKFVIANDYSLCISDTLTQDLAANGDKNPFGNIDEHGNITNDGKYNANIRFMWNRHTNTVSRAYVAAASDEARKFLVLKANKTIQNESGQAINNNEVVFKDTQNWLYERTIKVQPGTLVKLYACYPDLNEEKAQHFRGKYSNDFTKDVTAVQILGGTSSEWYTMRIIYDFKTNRLMGAWVPDQNINGTLEIDADIMVIRQHQEDATYITFTSNESELTKVKTVYGVMRFNRWTLNNRSTTTHDVLPVQNQKSIYERALYFISFPFDVHLSDVFGFGTYGTHWVISEYNGLRRAQNGYFVDNCMNEDCTNWDYIWDPDDFTMRANQGYLLSLDLDLMKHDNTSFWAHDIQQVELFFPSFAHVQTIQQTSYTMPALSGDYECKINFNNANPGETGYNPANDHRVRDSYWRCIGVPSFADYNNTLTTDGTNKITWQPKGSEFPFLYEWNVSDNSLMVRAATNYKFRSTFAYLVQNGNPIYWSAVNTKPSNIVARSQEAKRNYDWKITIARNGEVEDQTFVRLTDHEKVTTEFDFNQDLSKEFNYGRSDIYTLIGYEKAAANSLPLSEQTTLIPLGLSIEYNGDYTIAMPDGTANIGVTLIDTESNTRTNLSAGMEYTLTLNKGDYNNRFFIEISPIQQTPTDIEYVTGDSNSQDCVRKVLIDNILYIVRDGQMFDARGARVK